MKRLVVLLLAVLLPLQLAWGAAAAYCQHEAEPRGATHFGHHAHALEAAKPAAGQLTVDADCGFCNSASAAALPAFETLAPPPWTVLAQRRAPECEPASAPPRAPDRPQWLRLA